MANTLTAESSLEHLRQYLENNGDPNMKIYGQVFKIVVCLLTLEPLLIWATYRNEKGKVELLLDFKAIPNIQDWVSRKY